MLLLFYAWVTWVTCALFYHGFPVPSPCIFFVRGGSKSKRVFYYQLTKSILIKKKYLFFGIFSVNNEPLHKHIGDLKFTIFLLEFNYKS